MTIDHTEFESSVPSSDEEAIAADVESSATALPREPISAPVRRARRKKNTGRWVGFGLIVGIVALVASTVHTGSGAFTYSKYVDEVMAQPQRWVGTELRVEGVVEAGTVLNTAGSNRFAFHIERNHASMPVEYVGLVPDTFREGIGVTVRGRLQTTGTFLATEVVAKCPSKYEMQAAQARGQRMPGGIPGMSAPAAPQ